MWWWREAWLGLSRDWPWQPAPAPSGGHWDQRPGGEPGLPRLVSGEQHLSGGLEVHQGPLCPVQLGGLGAGTGCGSPNPQRPPRPGRGANRIRTRAAGAGRSSSYRGGGHRVISPLGACTTVTEKQIHWSNSSRSESDSDGIQGLVRSLAGQGRLLLHGSGWLL